MMLYTSYFDFAGALSSEYLVSIAGRAPGEFAGASFRALAPKYDWWKKWHDEKLGDEWYCRMYRETVLDKLEPLDVMREIGDDKILLCWEPVGSFCHRHLAAEWLARSGVSIRELTIFDRRMFSERSK